MQEQGVSAKSSLGRTPKGAYSTRGRSRHLLETPFSEPLLGTLLRTLFYCKIHSRPPSQNPSENPSPFPRTSSEPFLECCVAVRPLRRESLLRGFQRHADAVRASKRYCHSHKRHNLPEAFRDTLGTIPLLLSVTPLPCSKTKCSTSVVAGAPLSLCYVLNTLFLQNRRFYEFNHFSGRTVF